MRSGKSISVGDVLEFLNEIYPPSFAMEGDHCGLLCGRRRVPVGSILVVLDPDRRAFAEARSAGADLLISHHPPWAPGRIPPGGRTRLRAERVPLITAHTNADFAPGGLCDLLAEDLGLERIRPLMQWQGLPVGRVGLVRPPRSWRLFRGRIERSSDDLLRVSGVLPAKVGKVALCSGAGGDLIPAAFKAGADLFVTGDIKYHSARSVLELARGRRKGFAVVDAGHFGTEKRFIEATAKRLARAFPGLRIRRWVDRRPFEPLGGAWSRCRGRREESGR